MSKGIRRKIIALSVMTSLASISMNTRATDTTLGSTSTLSVSNQEENATTSSAIKITEEEVAKEILKRIEDKTIFGQAQEYSIVTKEDMEMAQHVEGNIAIGGDLKVDSKNFDYSGFGDSGYREGNDLQDCVDRNNVIEGKVENLEDLGLCNRAGNDGIAKIYLNSDYEVIYSNPEHKEKGSLTIKSSKYDQEYTFTEGMHNKFEIEIKDAIDFDQTFDSLKDTNKAMAFLGGKEFTDKDTQLICNTESQIVDGLHVFSTTISNLCSKATSLQWGLDN